MFPTETSLIPIAVTIAKFTESLSPNIWLAIRSLGEGWFPYWYLGIPARYITGPIVPVVLTGLHRLLPGASLFDLSYVLIILSFLLAALGWGLLVKQITRKRELALIVFILTLILPWRYLSALAMGETSEIIAKNLIPWALLVVHRFLLTISHKSLDIRSRAAIIYGFVAVSSVAGLLLISTNVLSVLLVGIASLIVAISFNKGKLKKVSKYIKPSLLILISGLVLSSLWYTPNYWITLLLNPSVGGAPGIKVIGRVFDLLKGFLPFVAAVFAVYFSGRVKKRITVFALVWLLFFSFLTMFRFIGDPDFWQDWTTWIYEVEIGIAILVSTPIVALVKKVSNNRDVGYSSRIYIVISILLLTPILLTSYIYQVLGTPELVNRKIPDGVKSLEKLEELAGDPPAGGRTFISGSTVFWAGSIGEQITQVRGGADRGALHPYWDHAAYQLREGKDFELASAWLEALGVEFVLVHTPASTETYHDFRNISKWNDIGQIIWKEEGDAIIKTGNSFAWVVDLAGIKKAQAPESGIDIKSLEIYLASKIDNVDYRWEGDNKIVINFDQIGQGEGLVVTIAYNRRWTANQDVRLIKDILGNTLITPEGSISAPLILTYR